MSLHIIAGDRVAFKGAVKGKVLPSTILDQLLLRPERGLRRVQFQVSPRKIVRIVKVSDLERLPVR